MARFITHTIDFLDNVIDTPPQINKITEVIVWEATNTKIDGKKILITYMIMNLQDFQAYMQHVIPVVRTK